MQFPSNCKYSSDHEWIRLDTDGTAYVGITDFAQSELGELVYVEVETIGKTLNQHDIFGTVEAVKTTSDLFMPVSGEVLALNGELDSAPDLINSDPYGNGWIVKIRLTQPAELDGLMDAAAYQNMVG